MARKKRPARRRSSKKRRKSKKSRFNIPWGKLLLSLLVVFVAYVAWLDFRVYRQFEGKRWSLPARVYARPLELYAGLRLAPEQFSAELRSLGYRPVSGAARRAGEISRNGKRFQLISRPFRFWDGAEPSQSLRLEFSSNQLVSLKNDRNGANIALARLDPLEIGSIHTSRQEDRILLQLDETPALLVNTLLAIEDRGFYQHHGISPQSIARAMWVNLQSGRVVQGGSTLTQQLVKNFFLTNQRSISRKLNEAIMSVLVEIRYSKDEILEAYINEIYLAQDGQRAIHGFGLGSQFFFQRPLKELGIEQIALLVGMVKGPSYYDPRRNPERAMQRRNLVLQVMEQQGLISKAELQKARRKKLGVQKPAAGTSTTFPGFLDLVRRQLRRDYQESDLYSEGLRIFTTLDPQIQWALQKSLNQHIQPMLKRQPEMQGAGVVTHSANGEVLALAGGRQAGFSGFNRALDAKRPIGSLIKPAVYLTAIERPQHYNLATLLDDSRLEYEDHGNLWKPNNYDRVFHGEVMLYQALAHSYNVATARLGLQLGVNRVIDTLRRLSVEQPLNPYPSLFLGSADMSPIDVTRMYQNFASGGFQVPLRAIRDVLDAEGEPLQRYDLSIDRVISEAPAFVLHRALQTIVESGTAVFLNRRFSPQLGLAGKTGTTNDLRDSWYAGYDGEKLGVIWMGRDDNEPMGLTGSSGALRVWADVYAATGVSASLVMPPPGVEIHRVDLESAGLADKGCKNTVQLAFISAGVLPPPAPCAKGGGTPGWLPDWMQ